MFIFASSSQLTWQLGVTEEGISLTEVSSNRESRDEGFTWFEMHNVKNVEAWKIRFRELEKTVTPEEKPSPQAIWGYPIKMTLKGLPSKQKDLEEENVHEVFCVQHLSEF